MSRHFGGVPSKRGPDQRTLILVVASFFMIILMVLAVVLVKKSGKGNAVEVTATSNTDINLANVVVPVRRIEVGEKLTPDMFRIELRSRFGLSEGVIGDLASTEGFYSRSLILPDQPLYRDYLTQYGSNNPIVQEIPAGFRAVSIRVDDTSSVEGWIRKGSIVDVQLVTKVNAQDVLKVIVEKAKVLSAERTVVANTQQTVDKVPTTVTLLVNSDDANKITLASMNGRLNLVLRNPDDDIANPASSIDMPNVMNLQRAAVQMEAKRSCPGRLVVGGETKCICANGDMIEADENGKCS